MVKVLIGSDRSWRLAKASVVLELIPPERNSPSGTSLIIRRSTDWASRWRSSSISRGSSASPRPWSASIAEAPVALDWTVGPSMSTRIQAPPGSLPHALEKGVRRWNEAVGEQLLQRAAVDRAADRGVLGERGQFGGEAEEVVPERIIQRLLAEPVAREEKPAARPVVDAEGEHPVEAFRQPFAPFLVAVDQNFRIRMIGLELVAFRLQRRGAAHGDCRSRR